MDSTRRLVRSKWRPAPHRAALTTKSSNREVARLGRYHAFNFGRKVSEGIARLQIKKT
jgi:hypothetical protein